MVQRFIEHAGHEKSCIGQLRASHAAGSTPSCDDGIAVVVDAQVTSAQANLVLLNSRYVNSGGTGFCAGTAPLVMAAYNVGASATNNRLAPSIWANSRGTRAVVLEKGTGSATPAKIHVITMGTGGTVSAPITPTEAAATLQVEQLTALQLQEHLLRLIPSSSMLPGIFTSGRIPDDCTSWQMLSRPQRSTSVLLRRLVPR